jgi:hypothetical protein
VAGFPARLGGRPETSCERAVKAGRRDADGAGRPRFCASEWVRPGWNGLRIFVFARHRVARRERGADQISSPALPPSVQGKNSIKNINYFRALKT